MHIFVATSSAANDPNGIISIMPSETDLLLDQAKIFPEDEASINCEVREYETEQAARDSFNSVKLRLRDIGNWNRSSGLSHYELFDRSGRQCNSTRLENGQFIKIILTGSGKSDWVRVERIHDSKDELIITVQPTHEPSAEPPQTNETSHFFVSDSRNNFCAVHDERSIGVYVIGLNEKLNSNDTSGLLETTRNAVVANLGYYLSIQSVEWKKFCHSILEGFGGDGE